jgi:sn-glycerol 3-phosphate transport system permease protein
VSAATPLAAPERAAPIDAAAPAGTRGLPAAMGAPRKPAAVTGRSDPYAPAGIWRALESVGAALLAVLWILPLAFAVWAAFHPPEFTTRFALLAPLTLENFERAWAAAPFARYFLNTFILVTMILACQLVLGTLAAYAFARFDFWGRDVAFALVLAQLMVMPDVLIVENYRTMTRLGLVDTIPAIALPYIASAFGMVLKVWRRRKMPKAEAI